MVSSLLDDSVVLQNAFDLINVPLMSLDDSGIVYEFNPAASRIWPKLRPAIKLAEIWGELHTEALRAFLDFDRQNDTEVAQSLTLAFDSEEGHRHIQWKMMALKPQKSGPKFLLVGRDQTDRERLADELQRSFRLVQDHKNALDESSIVALTDKRGVIQYVNDTFCRISGYNRSELIGKTHSVLKSGHHDADFFKNLWKTISSGRVWKGEIKNRCKDGSYYWVDTTIVPFMQESGSPYQYMAIRNDITEKKEMQENLERERMRTLHAEKMASLGELAAGIAHELGNPTASINAWLDVIESQHERNALDLSIFMQTIPKVRRDAKRIRDIIHGMLAYARDGSHDPFQTENPQIIIQQVLDYCSYKLRKSGVVAEVEVSNPYCTLECRMTEISQMLVIFILNACDAVQNLKERWIKITVKEVNEWIEFRITDSGSGIPEPTASKIFQPFFTTKSVGLGTGLGLSIASSIISNHKGSVKLDETSSHTSFVIRLPRRHRQGVVRV